MTHLMENVIYLELVRRGFSVDVGVVFSWETNKLGKRERIAREIDFVVNKGTYDLERLLIETAKGIYDTVGGGFLTGSRDFAEGR